jgi:hypothetical protein
VAGIVLILLVGGGLTAQILVGGDSLIIQQSSIPDASTLSAAPWQSEQLVLFIGFIVFNLVGMAATIAIAMWFLHRGVKQAEAEQK